MAAGGPGDHPLTDILHYQIEIYGPRADGLIRELERFLSPRELEDWWMQEIGWLGEAGLAKVKASEKLAWAIERAKQRGWDIGEDGP